MSDGDWDYFDGFYSYEEPSEEELNASIDLHLKNCRTDFCNDAAHSL